MTSQVVLNNVKSTQANPMGYWTVKLTPSNRTANSVTIKCEATCSLNSSSSNTQMGVTCSIYLGGSWYDFVMVPYGTLWSGTAAKTASTTVTISGLSASQTSITGIKFKAWAGDGEGPGLNATSCSNLTIDSHDGSVSDASVPQVVLSDSQSSLSSPYGFWTVTLTPRDRTTNSVVVDCEMSCRLQYDSSYTTYRVTCGLYLGGAWHDVEINPAGNNWSGKSPRTARMTVTVSGLTASQTSLTGIKFRAAAADGWGPGTADKACANLTIPSANAASTWSLSSSSINIGGSFSASITPVISTNYHTFKLANGSNSISFDNYTTSASLTATTDVVGYWFGSSATSLGCTLTMYTYASDGTYLGESSKSVTIKMTSAAGAPTGLIVSHSSTSKGTVKFTFVAPNAKYNASISNYSVSSNIGTASRSGTSVTVTIPSGASAASITLSVTATDSRGYTTSASSSANYNGVSTFNFGATSINLDHAIAVAVDEWVASNTYTLTANGITFANKATNNNTSCNFAADSFGNLFGSTSTTASTTMTCTTYDSSGSQIGSSATKTINLTMPSSVGAPTGMGLTITSASSTKIVATIIAPNTKYGATISNYVVTASSGTVSRSGNTITVTNSAGFGSGKVQISAYAVDSRGFNSNTAVVEKLNTVPKIILNGVSYEKVISRGKNVVAIYRGSTRIM